MKSWANTQRNSPGAMPPTHPKRRGIFLAFLLSAVACWGATFGAFRGIGEGGTASPRGAGAGARPLHTPNMRGALPLCSPLERALRPTSRGILQGRRSLRPTICEGAKPPLHSPMRGRSAPPPRVTFSPMRKSPKNLQGLRPLEPAGAKSPPFSRSLTHRAGLLSATVADGFATLRWCGQLATPSPLALTKRNILLLIRGSAGFWLHVWMQLWGRFGV